MIRKLFFVLIIMILSFVHGDFVNAEEYLFEDVELTFEFIGREDGLSNLAVSSIIQDKYGFLWFGTQGGLNCYDGRRIEIIRNDPFMDDGLVHNLIQTMYYDEEKHELWIGTYQGVSHYIISENRFENYTVEGNGLSNPIVIAITKDKNNNMWFGTMDGINKLDLDSKEIYQYEIPGNVVRSLLIDSKDRLLVGSYEGLLYFDKKEKVFNNLNLSLPSPYIMVVKEFDKGIITLGIWDGGVVEYNIETENINKKSFDDNRVYSLIKTENDTLWVGTWGGGLFTETRNGKITSYSGDDVENKLVHNVVYSMLNDDSGIVWIGTNGGGINKINPRKSDFVDFYHDVNNENSISQGKINKLFEDSEGNLWIAIYNNGVNVYNDKTKKIVKYMPLSDDGKSNSNTQVNDIIETEEGILLGTNAGINLFDKLSQTFTPWSELSTDVFVYALEQVNENELWIGSYHDGLFIYNLENKTFKNQKSEDQYNPVADNLIYDIHFDSKERIWIATNNGLNMKPKDSEEFKLYQRISGDYTSLGSNAIRSIYEDSQGKIWISMVGGGIAHYNDGDDNFTSFTEREGLSSNVVTGILEDSENRIWAATHNGISILDQNGNDILQLTPDDGIGGWEFSSGSIVDSEGALLFGGVHGVTKIPSSYIGIEMTKPRLYITDVFLFHEPYDDNRLFYNNTELKFDYSDSYLQFKVTALDYDSSYKTRFSFKLEGFDKDWINMGTRDYISYSNLPPGEYELFVIAETARNIVTEPVSLKFTVATPWYQTYVAYLSYLIVIVLLFIGFSKLREAKLIRIRNSELGKLNHKLEDANSQLEKLSTKDFLTNLFNRRYFDEMFNNQLKLAIRAKTHMSLILLDIDNFKEVNDHFGHLEGDRLLIELGQVISGEIRRSTDFVSRYGGDEIAIVLYDANLEGTLLIANHIKEEVDKIRVKDDTTKSETKITVSMGIVSVIPDINSTTDLYLTIADKALYESKKNGRNTITSKDEF